MTNPKLALALGLAVATLALCFIDAIGNVALVTKLGPAPVFSLSAIVLASAAFALSWQFRSYVVAGLLAASGIIFMVASVIATEYFAVIMVPGPILGVIFGLGILGLGLAKGIRTAKTAVITAS